MLVLMRRVDEKIVLGVPGYPPITLVVADICTNRGAKKVRIGIDAHKDISVHRLEVWNAIHEAKAEQTEAAP